MDVSVPSSRPGRCTSVKRAAGTYWMGDRFGPTVGQASLQKHFFTPNEIRIPDRPARSIVSIVTSCLGFACFVPRCNSKEVKVSLYPVIWNACCSYFYLSPLVSSVRQHLSDILIRRVRNTATISFVMSVCMSVRPHGTIHLPLDGFAWNLIFENFSKICRGNSSFIKIWQE